MRWISVIMRLTLIAVLLLLCAAMFYIIVIMGDSPKIGIESAAMPAQQQAASMPQQSMAFEPSQLAQVQPYFDAPLLTLSQNAGWVLQDIMVSEQYPAGVAELARSVSLRYTDAQGNNPITVASVTPVSSIRALLSRGFSAAVDQDWSMGGMKAVLMYNENTLHLYAQRDNVVYQIEGEIEPDLLRWIASLIVL